VTVPNFVEIAQIATEIWRFFDFSKWGHRRLAFIKLQIFNGRDAQEGYTASPCQILSKSLKPRLRYGDFSISKDGGRRHLGCLKLQIFNRKNTQEGQAASPCQISSKSRYGDFFSISNMADAAILDF